MTPYCFVWRQARFSTLTQCILTRSQKLTTVTFPELNLAWMIQKAQVPKRTLIQHRDHINQLTQYGTNFKIDVPVYVDLLDKVGANDGNKKRVWDYVNKYNGSMPGLVSGMIVGFPCAMLHPKADTCTGHSISLWKSVFNSMSPVYFSLSAIPLLVFKPQSLLKAYFCV